MGRKWNNIKEKKALLDKKRGANYTKVLALITIAAKQGGGDPHANFRLKIALQKARDCSVPKDNVEKAIKKGLGGEADNYHDVNYEGYGPEGVAIFVEAATDNVTRTIANVRVAFTKNGGQIGKEGCLQFVFERKAVFEFPKNKIDVDELTLELIDAGAEDVLEEDGDIVVKGAVESFGNISKKLEEMQIKPNEHGFERLPLTYKKVDKETFQKIMKLVSTLEDDDDVHNVYHNIEWDPIFEEP